MRMRSRLSMVLVFLLCSVLGAVAYPVYYKEQYYRLYHTHYIEYPDDAIENIYWLERAKKADFCNPLYALAKIEDKRHWERYRYLFDMHLDLKLIEQHLALGSKFDKRIAYFFNAPWKDQNLASLMTAETAYETALGYWDDAKNLAKKAMNMRWVMLGDAEDWMGEAYRIDQGELDFAQIIGKQLMRLRKVRADFEKMDASTY
ncbi:MAG: hypothetical protein ABSF43_04045 [Rectinemataceae bacterium]